MLTRRFIPTVVLAAAACAGSALAQTAPQWNRKAESVSFAPTAGGHQLTAHFRVNAAGFATTGDLSTDVLFLRGSALLGIQNVVFTASPQPAGGCGGGLCLSFQACICCSVGHESICTCGGFIADTSIESSSLHPGDEITVILRPSSGALPEHDISDDTVTATFQPCPTDFDGSGSVNGLDLATLLSQWTGGAAYAPCPPHRPTDLNDDCRVNGLDLALLLATWGPCGPGPT